MNNIFENDKVRAAYAKIYESNEEVQQTSQEENHSLTKENENNPAVWIGTYGNYNGGSLDGEGKASGWVDLTTFYDADEFHEWLSEQAGGRDVEWMFQDYMNFPKELYSESNVDKVWDYLNFKENNSWIDDEVLDAVLDEYSFDEAARKFEDGEIRIYPDCHSFGDVAQHLISEEGADYFSEDDYRGAFDYETYGRESTWDWSEDEHDGQSMYEAYGVSEDDDKALGEAIIEEFGGIEALGKETIMRYTDFESLGSDLKHEGNWITSGNNMIEVMY